MSTETVWLERNGPYWRAAWLDSKGRKRTRGIGNRQKISEARARRQCRSIERELTRQPGSRDAGRAPTLEQWHAHYLELRPGLAESTVRLANNAFALLIEHIGGDTRIDRIDRADAARWRAWLAGRGLTEATIRKHIRTIKAAFGERHGAVKYDLLTRNPFDRETGSSPPVDADWRYVTTAELDQVLDACPDSAWRALFALARLAGLRRGEAIRLQWADVDFDRRRLAVRHIGEATTKRRARVVPMTQRLHDVLLERFEACPPDERPAQVHAGNLERDAGAIIRRAGLEPWSKPMHTLRKNLETDWLARFPVMDVCRWLGHSPAVAAAHYHQPRPEIMDQAAGLEPDPAPERQVSP